MTDWPSEQIPDANRLFMRIHENLRREGSIIPGAFRNHGEGMSTDWEKYASPEDTRKRARRPAKNAVVSMVAGEVRQVADQRVEHTPDIELHNRSHTDVFGKKDEEIRMELRRIANIVIAFDTPLD